MESNCIFYYSDSTIFLINVRLRMCYALWINLTTFMVTKDFVMFLSLNQNPLSLWEQWGIYSCSQYKPWKASNGHFSNGYMWMLLLSL